MLTVLLASCSPQQTAAVASAEAQQLTVAAETQAAPQPTPTSDAVSPYSLEALANRSYGEGELRVEYAWQGKRGIYPLLHNL